MAHAGGRDVNLALDRVTRNRFRVGAAASRQKAQTHGGGQRRPAKMSICQNGRLLRTLSLPRLIVLDCRGGIEGARGRIQFVGCPRNLVQS